MTTHRWHFTHRDKYSSPLITLPHVVPEQIWIIKVWLSGKCAFEHIHLFLKTHVLQTKNHELWNFFKGSFSAILQMHGPKIVTVRLMQFLAQAHASNRKRNKILLLGLCWFHNLTSVFYSKTGMCWYCCNYINALLELFKIFQRP